MNKIEFVLEFNIPDHKYIKEHLDEMYQEFQQLMNTMSTGIEDPSSVNTKIIIHGKH